MDSCTILWLFVKENFAKLKKKKKKYKITVIEKIILH